MQLLTKKYENISDREFIIKFLELLNIIQVNPEKRLASKQIILLTEFIVLPDTYRHTKFKAKGKEEVLKRLKEVYNWKTNISNLNTNISAFRKKGFLEQSGDNVWYFNNNLKKLIDLALEKKDFEINFKFLVNGTDKT